MHLKAFALVLLAAVALAADGVKDTKPNPAIEKAVEPALAEATKSYGVYQDILAKATVKAVKELEKLKADAMKKGDLALAIAVDAQIKALKDGALADKVIKSENEKREGRDKDPGDLLGDTTGKAMTVSIDPKDPLIGRWKNNDEPKFERSYVFNKDGTGVADNYWKFTWKPQGESGYQATFSPDPNMKFNPERTIEWGERGKSFTVPGKGPFVFIRVEEKSTKGEK